MNENAGSGAPPDRSPRNVEGSGAALDPSRVRRLLVVRLDNVGDVVLLTPALRALRAALPDAHVTLLASPAGEQVGPLLRPWVDEVIGVRSLWQDVSGALPFDPAREFALIHQMAAGAYDAAVISSSFSQSPHPPAYACYLAGIPIRAALSPDFAGGVLSHPVPPTPDGTHQADRGLALVTALGAPSVGKDLALRVPAEAAVTATRTLADAGVTGGFCVAAPGASCPSRRYDPDRFVRVVAQLAAQTARPVVVVGGPREVELAQAVASAPAVVSIAGQTSVPELAAVIDRAAVVIANNSAPLHLAEALDRPVVALYSGAERESEFRPRRAPLRLLRRPTACTPCRTFACPYQLECLDLDPEDVVRAALSLLPATRRVAS